MSLFLLSTGTLLMNTTTAHAEESLVFVSAFATGDDGGIHTFHFDSHSGTLKLLQRTSDIENPFFLAISPDGRFLYTLEAENFGSRKEEFVAAFAIESRTGNLKRLNRQSSRGSASCYLDVDASGRTIVVANYSSGNVAALPLLKDGSLGEAASFIQHNGSSVDPLRQQGPYAHCIVTSPDSRFAFAADLGLDKILIYRLDPATARLSPSAAQQFAIVPPGSGPRHLIFHPSRKYMYVINELKNVVTVFDLAEDSGTLTARQTISTLPVDFAGTSHCADVKITPDGRFLYGTNRGHDSIALYRVADNGQLELTGIKPSLGKGPQNLLITPDGRWLLCANMPGNNVAVFRIDETTGSLSTVGEPIAITMPSCICWRPDAR